MMLKYKGSRVNMDKVSCIIDDDESIRFLGEPITWEEDGGLPSIEVWFFDSIKEKEAMLALIDDKCKVVNADVLFRSYL